MGTPNSSKFTRFRVKLKENLQPDDNSWVFSVHNIPDLQKQLVVDNNEKNSDDGQKICFLTINVTHAAMTLTIEKHSINRVLSSYANQPDEIISISFANFRFPDELPKATSEYIERLLTKGIQLNDSKYIFFGHSNSQLKSRTCYLLRANDGGIVMKKISEFGDFSKFMSVAKRAKRIGLLFSAAEASVSLDKKETEDIDDVESDGHIYTDGCGMMSKKFAQFLAAKRKIIFQNTRYCPSAFQIRYKGYKGMLMVNPELDKNGNGNEEKSSKKTTTKVQFRSSMKKFSDCPDNSFSILDFSKPFTYAFLNGELVTLLSCLGISDKILLEKQEEYFKFLESASVNPLVAFKYLCYKSEFQAAEDVLLQGLTPSIVTKIKKLSREEWNGTYKKDGVSEGNERVRIMIPESRILYGVCDYTGTLKEGECHVRITAETGGPKSIDGGSVIVSRNPCLHPGDIRKFKPVRYENLDHLIDVIAFPIVGKRDAASLMSGGDLDGDRFFVSWDPDLIPSSLSEPYGYPPAKETPRRSITYENMVTYFAKYNNSSLGRVKNLYLDWCRAKPNEGALSKECQELNAKFSSCVDGERIKIPGHLENPPKPEDGAKKFILDILEENVKSSAKTIFKSESEIENVALTTRDVLESLISTLELEDTNKMAIRNEYELYLMVLHWCRLNETSIEEFIHYFDFGGFTTPQKYAVLASLSGKWASLRSQYIGAIFNGLHQSDLLTLKDLRAANLHHPHVTWQKLYSSFADDGQRLPMNLEKAFEHFDKKMLVFEVDGKLKVAIYFPKRIEKYKEVNVGAYRDLVKVFGFLPESGQPPYRTNAKNGYRLTFDGEIFQLYLENKPNTFIWFALNEEYAKRNGIQSRSEFKVSIALQKFNYQFSQAHGRVTKQPSTGIELYVISNRDRVGHQILENSMNGLETVHLFRNLENTPKDYEINSNPPVGALDRDLWPEYCKRIILENKLSDVKNLASDEEIVQVFQCCKDLGEEGIHKLSAILDQIIEYYSVSSVFSKSPKVMEVILSIVDDIPRLAILVVPALKDARDLEKIEKRPGQVYFKLSNSGMEEDCYLLASALILSTNDREGPFNTFNQFEQLLRLMADQEEAVTFSLADLAKLAKMICFTIRNTKLGQDYLNILLGEDEIVAADAEVEVLPVMTTTKYFKKSIHSLAAEYLAEVEENCPCDSWGIPYNAEHVGELPKLNGPRNHLETLPTLSEFCPSNKLFKNGDSIGEAPVPDTPSSGKIPVPAQICLEITHSDKPDIFETILRTDVKCNIRNEDHLRFCASKRSTNNIKRRITVFDAVAISVIRGKLQFRILQKPIPVELTLASWNVYVCASTTNMSTMFTATLDLINLGPEATLAYNCIIPHPTPETPPASPTKIDISIDSTKFNESQIQAVKEALNNPMTLIWGPPGTGKTTVVVEIILNFLKNYPEYRILVSASTHNAVDNVMERFLKEREKLGKKDSDDAVRLTSDVSKVSGNLKKWTLDAFVGANIVDDDRAKGAAAKKIKEATIVFSTCSGAGVGLLRSPANDETSLWPLEDPNGKKAKKKKKMEQKFDVVIVDEASQITEPNAIIPIVKASKFVVLVGDHVQLRPTVSGEIAKELGLETSLFERLYDPGNLKPSKVMLNIQYRMHPNLSKFSSEQFYEGKLMSGVLPENRILPSSGFPWPEEKSGKFPFVFMQCTCPESFGQASKSNKGQVEMTIKVVKLLRSNPGSKEEAKKMSIIILTPYSKQVAMIKDELKSGGAATSGIEVNTIDGFQGREADIIIFSTVRANRSQNLGFLEDKRRMNVAVTRARFGLIVIGEQETLKENGLWNNLMSYGRRVDLLAAAREATKGSSK